MNGVRRCLSIYLKPKSYPKLLNSRWWFISILLLSNNAITGEADYYQWAFFYAYPGERPYYGDERFSSAPEACQFLNASSHPIDLSHYGPLTVSVTKTFKEYRGSVVRNCIDRVVEYVTYRSEPIIYDQGQGQPSLIGNTCPPGYVFSTTTRDCINKNAGPPLTCAGNPVNILTGNKYQREVDYPSQTTHGVRFERVLTISMRGYRWLHTYQNSIDLVTYNDHLQVNVRRANGAIIHFRGSAATDWSADVDVKERLISLVDNDGDITGWKLILSNDSIEHYNASGRLLKISNRVGLAQTLDYELSAVEGGDDIPSTLDRVTDHLGNQLFLRYDDDNRLIMLVDPDGGVYRYAYNANNRLQYVSYPDNTASTSGASPFNEDNPYREYHYENTLFPSALTGITDEQGHRFATWQYDSEGRAISSEHAGETEKVTLDYTHIDDTTDPRVTTTNALGKNTTYHYTTVQGVRKVTKVEGHPSANCAGANKNYTYDTNGFMASKTDWKGNVTTYINNARGQELSRTEASGTPQARTITTEWHADYNLPIKITEPSRITTMAYDSHGRLLSRNVTER